MSAAGEIVAAYRAGRSSWDSAPRGVDVPNPWNGTDDTARERVLARVWRRGRLDGVDPALRAGAR